MKYLLYYLLIINAVAWAFMLADKLKAKKNAWRISEATLIGIAVLGGSLGGLLGMLMFRHKTRHLKFSVGLPVLFVLHLTLLFFLFAGI